MTMYKNILFFLVVVILAAGCSRKQLQPNATMEEFERSTTTAQERGQDQRIPEGAFTPAQTAPAIDEIADYVLGPGDLVTITVFEVAELNTEARVSSRGLITMPLLGQVHVQGLSALEAEKKIEQDLSKDYMHEAHVTLFVKERVSQQITIVGAVKTPGTYETKATKRILEVLSMAGGVTKFAGDTVYITRHKKQDGNDVYLVDLEKLLEEGRMDMNMFVQGGDTIFVPQNDVVQVEGAVKMQGPVKIEGRLTIDEAIAAAGGLAQYADDEDIKLIRKDQNGERQIIQLTMEQILAMKQSAGTDSKGAPWQQLQLQDGDVIYAEADGLRSFYSGVGFTIGFLGTGVSYKNPVENNAPLVRDKPTE